MNIIDDLIPIPLHNECRDIPEVGDIRMLNGRLIAWTGEIWVDAQGARVIELKTLR